MEGQPSEPTAPVPGAKPIWASVIVSVVVLGWTMTLAYFLGHEIDKHLIDEAQAVARHIQTQNLQYMGKRELSLVSVQAFFASSDSVSQAEYTKFTSAIMSTMPGIRSINRLDDNLTIQWVSPANGNRRIQNLNLTGLTGEPAARHAKATGKLSATNPIDLVEGGRGILLFLPVRSDGKPAGLVQSVNRLERYQDYLDLDDLASEANLRLRDAKGAVIYSSGTLGRLLVNQALPFADQTWHLEVSPRASWLDFLPVYLVWAVGLSIWAASLLFIWSDVFAARRLAREVSTRTAELARSLAELQSLDRMKNDFLSVVTHELRTPLTSIKGYAEFLEDEIGGPLAPPQKEYVGHIQYNAEQLEMLVDDLLDLARLESGKFTLRLQTTDGVTLARQVAEAFQPRARELGLTLETELPNGPESLEADPHRVTQVLNNLVSNAVKFTPPGGRVVLALRPAPDRIAFSVSDTGIGISPDNQARIFSKFFQVESQLNRSFKGTGLGLAITKGLIEAHHGEIGVESALGRGTTVTLLLPRRQPESMS